MSRDFAVQSRSRMERQMVVRSYRSRECTCETWEGMLGGSRERTIMKNGNNIKASRKPEEMRKEKILSEVFSE